MMSNAELGLPNKLRRNPSVIQYTLKEMLENDTLFIALKYASRFWLQLSTVPTDIISK